MKIKAAVGFSMGEIIKKTAVIQKKGRMITFIKGTGGIEGFGFQDGACGPLIDKLAQAMGVEGGEVDLKPEFHISDQSDMHLVT